MGFVAAAHALEARTTGKTIGHLPPEAFRPESVLKAHAVGGVRILTIQRCDPDAGLRRELGINELLGALQALHSAHGVDEGDEPVRLAAPELGIEADDGVQLAAPATQAPADGIEQSLEALRGVGVTEEGRRILVLGGRFATNDLCEVCGEVLIAHPAFLDVSPRRAEIENVLHALLLVQLASTHGIRRGTLASSRRVTAQSGRPAVVAHPGMLMLPACASPASSPTNRCPVA